jgi:hypothetical protein
LEEYVEKLLALHKGNFFYEYTKERQRLPEARSELNKKKLARTLVYI